MFTHEVNTPCINGLFSGATIHRMPPAQTHASFQRLYDAALQVTAHLSPSRRIQDEKGLRKALNLSPQTANNWKNRGVSQEGAIDAQRNLGVSAIWVIDGKGPPTASNWTPTQHPSGAPETEGVDQELSDLKQDHELTPKPWEFVLSAVILPKRFCVAVPDGALAPKSPKGTEFVFVSPPQGQPGESVAVIVQTASGQRCMRLYFATGGGAWEARSRDPAFPSYHSERDGLQLLAVATMRSGGEG